MLDEHFWMIATYICVFLLVLSTGTLLRVLKQQWQAPQQSDPQPPECPLCAFLLSSQ